MNNAVIPPRLMQLPQGRRRGQLGAHVERESARERITRHLGDYSLLILHWFGRPVTFMAVHWTHPRQLLLSV